MRLELGRRRRQGDERRGEHIRIGLGEHLEPVGERVRLGDDAGRVGPRVARRAGDVRDQPCSGRRGATGGETGSANGVVWLT